VLLVVDEDLWATADQEALKKHEMREGKGGDLIKSIS
jgi:hypothetical protein